MKGLRSIRIRTRLLVVYTAIFVIGFGAIALIAGEQIESGARVDYSQRLENEIALIAQALVPVVRDYQTHPNDSTALDAALLQYGNQVNGQLHLLMPQPRTTANTTQPSITGQTTSGDENSALPAPASTPNPSNSSNPPAHDGDDLFHGSLELEAAVRGQAIVVERLGDGGENRLYTAVPVSEDGQFMGMLQLSVPVQGLQDLVWARWAELGIVFGLVAIASVAAAFWLARSIITPLETLRESAARLSTGEFSHRVAYAGSDEIGDVAHAFNEMAKQVESMLEEQRAFASNTSHELRTPLTTIRLRTEALRDDATMEPELAKRYIEEIDSEVVRMADLVQDLTLLSRFDAGRAELGKDQVDLPRFAASLKQHMTAQAADKQIALTVNVPDEPMPVNASLTHLTVVFRNLIDNAIKYTPAGGRVTWDIHRADGGVISTICDTGRGIDAAHLPHVFERFYRVDKARSRDIPGTGLGLSLVESIVRAYGGKVSINSPGTDQGTTVTVFLPLKSAA